MIPLSDPDLVRQRFPVITVSLIALNALVFLYQLFFAGNETAFYYTFGVIPEEFTSGQAFKALQSDGRIYDIATPLPTWTTLFTAMFIHGGILHIGSNMLYLWVFGDNVEGRMGYLPYLAFYLAAGVAAAWMQIATSPSSDVPMVGASGAIAGVLGAYFLMFPQSRIRTLVFLWRFINVYNIPAMFLLGMWILLQFWSGLGAATGGGVAYWAHIGGFIAGMAAVAAVRLARRQPVWQAPPRRSSDASEDQRY